jgi:hypothetical protein
MQKEVISWDHTPEPVWRVCFFPLSNPLRGSDWCIRRPSYEAQSAFPRARTSPLCPRPCHVLSLESNGEFPFARTVGVVDRAGELVVRAA